MHRAPGNTSIPDRGRLSAEHQLRGRTGEFWQACDRQIFVIECGIIGEDFLCLLPRNQDQWHDHFIAVIATSTTRWTHLPDDGKHPRLAVVVAVRADAEIDLLGVVIGLERRRELEDAVMRTSALPLSNTNRTHTPVRRRERDGFPSFCVPNGFRSAPTEAELVRICAAPADIDARLAT